MLNALRPLLLLAALAVVPAALAEDGRAQRSEVGERIRQVERDGGRVLRAERVQRGGEEVYRIKVLTPEGRVRVLQERPRQERQPLRTDRRSLMLRDRARRPAPRERELTPEPRPAESPRQPQSGSPVRRDD
jgi:hypothetical protein